MSDNKRTIDGNSPATINHDVSMKTAFWLVAVVLCISTILDAQHGSGISVVNADRPTIIAFFPNGSKIGSDDADGNEALNDFKYCAEHVKKPLSQRGIEFTEEFARSFRIRSGSESVLRRLRHRATTSFNAARGRILSTAS